MTTYANGWRHSLPRYAPSRKISRRKDKPHFYQITDDIIRNVPFFFESPEFSFIHKHPKVQQFIRDFWKWNAEVLWLLSSTSHPYIEMQEKLAQLVGPYLGETFVDLGCGTGNFCGRLFKLNGKQVKKIFAVDIDWESLAQVPQTLRSVGYRQKVALAQTSTMSKMPIWPESVDCVISSLGGLMYAGWWFEAENGGKLKLVCEGREALKKCLLDMNRIIKPGGHLAFSAPKPNPDFGAILRDSLWWLIKNGRFVDFVKILRRGFRAKKLSEFMHQVEREGHAHYISLEEWEKILRDAGFTMIDSNEGECYAKQGILAVARKVRNVN
ncbi:MAG: methyltransferase domain-containing protein [Patescibacteria group bacterium]